MMKNILLFDKGCILKKTDFKQTFIYVKVNILFYHIILDNMMCKYC